MLKQNRLIHLFLLMGLAACIRSIPAPTPTVPAPNLDSETQSLITQANRVVFVIPFSHWDTDWHEAFPDYVIRSDGNILAAMRMAQGNPRFRYTLEQVLFVRHFWETYPEHRAALKAVVENRQITFAWAGITQPETSLVAPAIQVRNLQLGQQWIAETFGPAYVPRTAWQSDAFGNSAAFPTFLAQSEIPYLFIGRRQGGCNREETNCIPNPHVFYWKTPAADARVLVAYGSYPTAWDAIHRLPTEEEQLAALGEVVEEQFERTQAKYIFLPLGSDFIDPLPNLPSLVDKWNAADPHTLLVMADPDTAFQYLATQPLPEVNDDFNPLWQAFYGSRPFAKIADKESEYLLTAADKFGELIHAPQSSAWFTATMNAHYDNIGAVSFDHVWEGVQRPRFEQTVATGANDLAAVLGQIASSVEAALIIFNPTSWPRSEVIELQGDFPEVAWPVAGPPRSVAPRCVGTTAVQPLGPNHVALYVQAVPAVGFAPLVSAPIANPATLIQEAGSVTLSNGLVSATLDAAHGGAFSSMAYAGGPQLLAGWGDDVTYWGDSGDIYGAFFEEVQAQESNVSGQITVLAAGPLLARAQVNFTLGGQPLTKTVTLRADSPLIEVALDIRAIPETSAVVHTPTTLNTQTRTDDLGFLPFTHVLDNRPIAPGDVTYRREIFYPITYWSDVTDGNSGLTLITHGLQGLAGTDELNLLLVRYVTEDLEGVKDGEYHTLRYAYLPHSMGAVIPWQAAYAFNQPLIPAWRSGDRIRVQLPFEMGIRSMPVTPAADSFPDTLSLMTAENGLIADLYKQDNQLEALLLDYDPTRSMLMTTGASPFSVTVPSLLRLPISLNP